MNKRLIIGITIVLLLAIGGGVFYYWQEGQKEEEREWVQIREAVKYPTAEEWEIIEAPEGEIVKNKKAGLEIKVPDGWKAEKTEIGRNEWTISLNSPDAKFSEDRLYPIAGCGAAVIVEYSKDDFEHITTYMKDHAYLEAEQIEIIKVSGYPATKESLGKNPVIGENVVVQVPINNKIYVFSTVLVPGEEERCSQEFEKFLEGITILQ